MNRKYSNTLYGTRAIRAQTFWLGVTFLIHSYGKVIHTAQQKHSMCVNKCSSRNVYMKHINFDIVPKLNHAVVIVDTLDKEYEKKRYVHIFQKFYLSLLCQTYHFLLKTFIELMINQTENRSIGFKQIYSKTLGSTSNLPT